MKYLQTMGVLGLIALAFSLSSCQNEPVGSAVIQTPAQEIASNPVKIAVFQDKTGSANQTRTPQLTPLDFNPLIDLVRKTGGEIAFGRICDQSNQSLHRIRFGQPPVPPTKPIEPTGEGNPLDEVQGKFDRDKQQAEYQQKLADYQKQQENRNQEIDREVKKFLDELEPTLKQDANCRATDIWGAVQRADLFLAESDASWSKPTHRYAVFVTDGIDNINTPAVTMTSKAKVILVNGAGDIGSLKSLNPVKFEGANAAFQEILANERGN